MSKIGRVVDAVDDAIISNYDAIMDVLTDYLNEEITDGQFLSGMDIYRGERARLMDIKSVLNEFEREENINGATIADTDAGTDR